MQSEENNREVPGSGKKEEETYTYAKLSGPVRIGVENGVLTVTLLDGQGKPLEKPVSFPFKENRYENETTGNFIDLEMVQINIRFDPKEDLEKAAQRLLNIGESHSFVEFDGDTSTLDCMHPTNPPDCNRIAF